ncbi:class I SAM-dependent methyltransferase [Pedobacter hartonius]|uniref:Methyltransferase domain-containing protein n=1 Tax=Pedobacter hartonius TaxID=425514 RepID=A0A1H4E1G0_9SPHI|nr:class I SAM-dependent methyltransferase [Pedobacter hartonius]SEA78657.1 Methyltransferase domain-containing protein [Pedobacter hartonius]
MNLIDSEISNFYTRSSEESRLTLGLGPLEFERNKDLISRYLPDRKGLIADIGGGPGHYAQWLAALGHNILLVDPVPKHIQQAERRSKRSKYGFRAVLGEARALPMENNSADVVILHGPLYHLQDLEERLAVLKEARRILKIGGVVLGFGINHAASTLAALQNGLIHHDQVFAMCKQELLSGEHYPPADFPGILAQAFFHSPSALISEFKAAGFNPTAVLAVEGMAWMDQQYFESWSSPAKKRRLLELLKLTEANQELLCLSPHMMLAAEVDHMAP